MTTRHCAVGGIVGAREHQAGMKRGVPIHVRPLGQAHQLASLHIRHHQRRLWTSNVWHAPLDHKADHFQRQFVSRGLDPQCFFGRWRHTRLWFWLWAGVLFRCRSRFWNRRFWNLSAHGRMLLHPCWTHIVRWPHLSAGNVQCESTHALGWPALYPAPSGTKFAPRSQAGGSNADAASCALTDHQASILLILVSAPPALIATLTASSIGSFKGTSIRSNPFSELSSALSGFTGQPNSQRRNVIDAPCRRQ